MSRKYKNEITEIESSAQFNEIFNDSSYDKYKYIFVDFYATWCGPCKRIEPDLKKLCEDFYDVKFIKVDVDKISSLSKQYKIKAMPTFLLFDRSDPTVSMTYETLIGADINKIKDLLMSTRKNDEF
jgi:thioredoxin 1